MVRQGHHHHDHGAEMYGYNQSHNTSTDTNRWNTEDNTPDVYLTIFIFSDKSLVSSFNSAPHRQTQTQTANSENIWSLTNRIHHDGMGRGRDPEYSVSSIIGWYNCSHCIWSLLQGPCCKGAHYALGVFGVLLVLTVCVLITWETVVGIINYEAANATETTQWVLYRLNFVLCLLISWINR